MTATGAPPGSVNIRPFERFAWTAQATSSRAGGPTPAPVRARRARPRDGARSSQRGLALGEAGQRLHHERCSAVRRSSRRHASSALTTGRSRARRAGSRRASSSDHPLPYCRERAGLLHSSTPRTGPVPPGPWSYSSPRIALRFSSYSSALTRPSSSIDFRRRSRSAGSASVGPDPDPCAAPPGESAASRDRT